LGNLSYRWYDFEDSFSEHGKKSKEKNIFYVPRWRLISALGWCSRLSSCHELPADVGSSFRRFSAKKRKLVSAVLVSLTDELAVDFGVIPLDEAQKCCRAT